MRVLQSFVVVLLFSLPLQANIHSATLVFKKGDVVFLSDPQEKVHSTKGQVLFEGKYYRIGPAKLGRKVQVGDAVKVGPNGQAKLTFNNGDQFIVGPGSIYALEAVKANSNKEEKQGDVLKLFYGKMRGIISKAGPRNQMQIQTRGTVAGVRGTDFCVFSSPEKVNFTVLRGKVSIQAKKNVIVTKGMSANVDLDPKVKNDEVKDIVPQLQETTKSELLSIQQDTMINAKEMQSQQDLKEDVKKEIQELELKAKDVVIADIKSDSDGKLTAAVDLKNTSVDQLNSEVVFGLYKKAPMDKTPQKQSEEDLNNSDENVYKRYFEQ